MRTRARGAGAERGEVPARECQAVGEFGENPRVGSWNPLFGRGAVHRVSGPADFVRCSVLRPSGSYSVDLGGSRAGGHLARFSRSSERARSACGSLEGRRVRGERVPPPVGACQVAARSGRLGETTKFCRCPLVSPPPWTPGHCLRVGL